MNILLFLSYWAVRVVEWFSTLYQRGRDIVIHFVDYVSMYAVQAAYSIVGFVTGQINQIVAYIMSLTSQIYNIALAAVQQATGWLLSQFYAIRDSLLYQFYNLRDWLVGLYNTAINSINSIYAWVTNFVQSNINNAIAAIQSAFAWLYSVRDFLLSLLSIFTPNNLQKFLDFIQRMYPQLLLFLENPIFFILDLIKDKFISFLCMVLAYGFGTTNRELPSFSTWKNR